MSNVHTLNDIKDREGGSYKKPGHRLDKYNEQEKESQRTYADIGNKISQLNASSTKVRSQLISEQKSHSESRCELEAKYSAKIKSLKLSIKSLKRELTLVQKALSVDKITILSLETKVRCNRRYGIDYTEINVRW
ncbi:unnamed protein product [Rhizophagus irregularis]|uniref:Uncharacterized protein n=1 Tax=Rhizophagus irregularis TaxID=588596 RepID=A0A2I1H8M1_9GLOM|nr:hypothetical protein RhiirA4_474526 [Rhizophagus irregularis]CAB4439598.1 unnamed protein product [Rhizophagus irregularis]